MMQARQQAIEIQGLLDAGSLKPALRSAKSAQRAHPRNTFFANLMGVAHTRLGDPGAAIAQFRKAARLHPGFREPLRNLAGVLLSQSRTGEARRIYEKLAQAPAPEQDVLRGLALARLRTGDANGAADMATRLLNVRPDDSAMFNLRGVAWAAQNRYDAALADYRAALALTPGAADVLANMALPLTQLGQHAAALAALEDAIKAAPTHTSALHRYGVQLLQLGRFADARSAFARLVAAHPNHAEGLRERAALARPKDTVEIAAQIDTARRALAKSAPTHALLDFADYYLAQTAQTPDVAARLARANATTRKHRPWNADTADTAATAIISGMPHLPAPLPVSDGPRPVFILGLPRSGTTLVEHILSAHPAVSTLGEYPGAERWMQTHTPTAPFDRRAVTNLAHSYRAGLMPFPAETRVFTDKMPGNFRLIGHLLTAFPRATILHLTRDPLDTAWSIWRTWFSTPGLNFAYDQTAIARYFNMYARMMTHWQALAGPRLHHIAYRDLVTDIDASSRDLAARVGLDWHPAMATPHENTRAVGTASLMQVRTPVHGNSLGLGHRNAALLQEFTAALDPALWSGSAPWRDGTT